jgi:RNA polymerase sigma factor (sigma-70 family)
MTASALNPVVRYLSRLTASSASDLSDTDLLERFRARGEESAFTLLMQRHGPAVLGVCRRLLGNAADVDDAFQATFLVLLRKARSIRRSASLGCWLYGVAYRVAAKARARRLPGLPAGNVVVLSSRDPVAETYSRELAAVLDEEIRHLPERYRAPFILCVLESRTYEQAARELGSSKSSLARHVEQARTLLQRRLTRRGILVSAAMLSAALASEASAAAVPAVLTLATIQLVTRAAKNGAGISAPVATLARQAMPGAPLVRMFVALGLILAPSLAVVFLEDNEPAAPPPPAAKAANASDHVDGEGFPVPAEALARVGSAKYRHGGSLNGLHYSPDGKLLATTGGPRVRVWDVQTGKVVQQFPPAEQANLLDAVSKMLSVLPGQSVTPARKNLWGGDFTADGKTVVVLDGGTCRWFDVRTGRETRSRELKFDHERNLALFAPRGTMVVVGDKDASLVLFELPSGKELARLIADRSWLGEKAFSADGKMLAAVEDTAEAKRFRVRLFETETGQPVGSFDIGNNARGMAFSPDGKKLLGYDGQKHIQIWSVPDGKSLHDIEADVKTLTAVAFAPDGKSIVAGSQLFKTVRIDLATGKERNRYPTEYPSGTRLAFSPDGKELAVGVIDGVLSRWDLTSGQRKGSPAELEALARPMRFDATNRLLHVWDGALTTVDWQSGKITRRLSVPHSMGNFYLAESPDHSRLAGINAARKIAIWDTATGQEQCVLSGQNDEWLIPGFFSSDNKLIYTIQHDAPGRVWDATTGKQLAGFGKERRTDHRMVVSPNGKRMAVVSNVADEPREIIIWDTAERRELWHLLPVAGRWIGDLSFSPDSNSLVAVGGDIQQPHSTIPGFIQLWDMRTGTLTFADTDVPAGLYAVAFSADGRTLVTGDNVVRLWEVFTGRERHQFHGHDTYVYGLTFSPDGKLVASVSCDAPLFVWDVEGCYGKPPSDIPFSDEEKTNLWDGLRDRNASAAFGTLRLLLARPGPAVALLRERLRPSTTVDEKTIRKLFQDLDGEDLAIHEKAARELQALADRAEPILRKALTEKPSARVKQCIEAILKTPARDLPERRLQVRAVEALERIGSKEAREVLASLARGAKDAFLTREARLAVERLKGR